MGLFNDIVNGIAFGPHRRKVKNYLDAATPDTVRDDMQKQLTARLSIGNDYFKRVFDACCVEDPPRRPYWIEDSFKKQIQRLHPDMIPLTAIHVLWRSFHFHAYYPFPFPLDPANDRIEFDAFHRAMTLLVAGGTDLLGILEDPDCYWRLGLASSEFLQSGVREKRIYKSIGYAGHDSDPKKEGLDSRSTVEDLAEVLAMTQPQYICEAPSIDDTEQAARRLLGEEDTRVRYRVDRRDFVTLLCLLLRLKLAKHTWGSPECYYGDFVGADPADEELAQILSNGLGRGDMEDMTSDQMVKMMELMQNLHLRFQQLWAVLFQPENQKPHQEAIQVPETIPARILGALALTIPAMPLESWPRHDRQIALERPLQPSQTPTDMTVTRVVKTLVQEESPYLVVCTGKRAGTTDAAVVGAYFPGPLWTEANDGMRRGFQTAKSHLLFQLQPHFRILRWTKPSTLLREMIQTDDGTPSVGAIAAKQENEIVHKPYRIGTGDTALHIDPTAKAATLTGGWRAGYRCLGSETICNRGWELPLHLDRLDIFGVSGGIVPDQYTAQTPDLSRYQQDPEQRQLRGPELQARIQGWGQPRDSSGVARPKQSRPLVR